MKGGYTGEILKIDLSERKAHVEELQERIAVEYIGGGGINARLALDLIKPGEDPFSPGNVLLIGAGPFVGTLIPGSSKCNITSKSPHKKFIGTSGSGHLGFIKFAGFDNIAIFGKSEKPTYLKIFNDRVEFKDASHIWGKDIYEATDIIRQEVGNDYAIACIGPAGENLVKDSLVLANKYSAFARSGMGAIMGSKHIKAIAIYGNRGIKVAQPKRFKEALRKVYNEVVKHPNFKEWRTYGTLISHEAFARNALYPSMNFRESPDHNKIIPIFDIERFKGLKLRDVACLGCPVGCKHLLEVGDKIFSLSCALSSIQAFGGACHIKGWEEILQCSELANRLGLDVFSTVNLITMATELFERGIIKESETDGLKLEWGNPQLVREIMRKIAYREGFGNILAEGLIEAPKIIGKGAEYYAMHVKGLGLTFDLRPRFSADNFSQIVNPRGAHPSSVSVTLVPRSPDSIKRFCQKIKVPENRFEEVLKGPDGFNPARLTKWSEDYTFALDALGVCRFPIYQRIDLSLWTELYSSITGMETSPEEILQAAERALNAQREFNLREGAAPEDDIPPRRFFEKPLKFGEKTFDPLNERHMMNLLGEYYQERGWSIDT
ncbi:MAG: aldehyde ferredoxin oxidoreductase family protein [Deltaproteobacteria bacterium]|nr:aldehyde ferredoxin oxidoreductase family protein [Deltaproteobacteria bacterium]